MMLLTTQTDRRKARGDKKKKNNNNWTVGENCGESLKAEEARSHCTWCKAEIARRT